MAPDEPIILGPGPFSSPDPATEGYRQIPIDDGEGAADAADRAAAEEEGEGEDGGYEDMTVDQLHEEAEKRGVEVEGTGANGNKVKADYVKALTAADEVDAANGEGDGGDNDDDE